MYTMKTERAILSTLFLVGLIWAQRFIIKSPRHQPGQMAPQGIVTSLEAEISIPFMPKVGETFVVTLATECKADFESIRFGPNYTAMFISEEAEIIKGAEEKFSGYMKKGDTKQFQAEMTIKELHPKVTIFGGISAPNWPGPQGVGFTIYLVDPEIGQYGTEKEYREATLGILGKYNNLEPQWLSEPDPMWVDRNRIIVEEMREFVSTLSDSEALCLHQDNYLLIINAVGDSSATDSERIEHLLEAGWLEAQRSAVETKEKWLIDFMKKNLGSWR